MKFFFFLQIMDIFPYLQANFKSYGMMKRICFLLIICILTIHPVDAQKKRRPQTGTINGHEYVDLGLSVKWATCNIGASSPTDYGDYYAWGELQPKNKYYEKNCLTYKKSMYKISCNKKYDAARANWGGSWRLPSKKEIKELVKKCKWEVVTRNGRKVYKVTGPNGNSIFFPTSGYRYGSLLYFQDEVGFIWGELSDRNNLYDSYCLKFSIFNNEIKPGWSYRHYGRNIRPVSR